MSVRVEFGSPIYAGEDGGIGEAVMEETRRLMENSTGFRRNAWGLEFS